VVGSIYNAVLIKKSQWNGGSRLGDPLAIGIWEEWSILSASTLLIEYTSNAVYLEDGEMANIRLHKVKVRKKKIKMTLSEPIYSGTSDEFGQIEKVVTITLCWKKYEQPKRH
jgi:glucosamine--fructose-6-phosphate aminotransferase (isomerizing)